MKTREQILNELNFIETLISKPDSGHVPPEVDKFLASARIALTWVLKETRLNPSNEILKIYHQQKSLEAK